MKMWKTDTFKQNDLVKELLIDIRESPEFECVPGQCCIYRVPKTIRRVNDDVYTPQLISIGPFHHGKQELAYMEKKKKKYVKRFIGGITTEKRDQILSHIKDNEERIRNCYAEVSTLGSLKFVKMILYDSILVIQILRKSFQDGGDILLLDTMPESKTLWNDLQLFENQLPYFILKEIYELTFDELAITFKDLSVNFFGNLMGIELSRLTPESEVKHFTDWRRRSLLKGYPGSMLPKEVRDLPCATKLHESGVKFKGIQIEAVDNLLDIRFEKRIHELQIPQLQVDDETECLLRNIIALEQCLYPNDARVCNYVELIDYLINTVEDVDSLVEKNIISNLMGNNAAVADMFSKLNQHVYTSPSPYYDISKQLKEHYRSLWNRTKATLKSVYFNNLWRGTATVTAVILLLLTIAQTVFSVLQVV